MDIIKAKRIVNSFFEDHLGLTPEDISTSNEFFNLCAGARFDGFYCNTIIFIGYDTNGLLQTSVMLGKILKPTFDIYNLINEYNSGNAFDTTGLFFRACIYNNELTLSALMPLIAPNKINIYLDLILSNLALTLTKNPAMEKLCNYIIE